MDLALGSRFAVVFFIGGSAAPNPIDIRFHEVSGLSATIETTSVNEGGQNLHSHKLPKRVGYGNITLKRGFLVGSPLNTTFDDAMRRFQFHPSNVMITLLNASAATLHAWMVRKAFPVRWATGDLSASDHKVQIDTLELAYASIEVMKV